MQQWINDNGNVTVDDDNVMIDDSDDRQCEANDVMVDHNDATMPTAWAIELHLKVITLTYKQPKIYKLHDSLSSVAMVIWLDVYTTVKSL